MSEQKFKQNRHGEVPLGIYVKPELMSLIKICAASEDETIKSLVTMAIKVHLESKGFRL